jgi:hypothetical protein
MASETTQTAILDAAERLLAEVGYAAMSLRAVTQEAKANLAAVNYHFGGKEQLAKAVMLRRITPVNAARMERLQVIEADARTPGPRTIRAVVEAFVAPVMELAHECGPRPCAMVGRMLTEQPPFLRPFLAQQFGEVAKRFAEALRDAQPGLPLAEAWWQLHFVLGAMTHTMLHLDLLQDVAGKAIAPASVDEVVDRLASFCAAGARGSRATTTASPRRVPTNRSRR